MSTFWHITVEDPQVDIEAGDLLAAAYRIMPEAERRMGVRKRVLGAFSLYEPLFDRDPMLQIYTARAARRKILETCIRSLSLAAMESGGRVGFAHSSPPGPSLISKCEPSRLTVEQAASNPAFGWWELDLGLVGFLVRRVHARFWTPLRIDTTGMAAGFLADYAATAHDCVELRSVVRAHLADEGAFASELPPPEVTGSASGDEATCERVGGRILYPDGERATN